jgi:hypothetical protein
MQIKLFWKPDLANAYFVAEKQSRCDQPVLLEPTSKKPERAQKTS